MSVFLFELGTEELPPLLLRRLTEGLVEGVTEALRQNNITFSNIRGFGTPRRLALLADDIAESQPDTKIERRGPSLEVAFDGDGNPSKAATGFARSCGVEVSALDRLETDKGSWLVFRDIKAGQPTQGLLPGILSAVVSKLTAERMMRWGASRLEFIRPVRWCCMLWDNDIVEGQVLGLDSTRVSRGHRFMCTEDPVITEANDYVASLREAFVIADQDERVSIISKQLVDAAMGDRLNENEALLDEVAALTEWPVVLRGNFPPEFLTLPEEVLITAMEKHQRYFALKDASGRMVSSFLTVANLASKDPAQVVAGNERVIRPRLADADFFWRNDTRLRLEERVDQLKSVVFQTGLGSYYDKALRIVESAAAIARQLQADEAMAKRGALLCKADLVTDMVIEFTDLQGVMGGHYARHDGEDDVVANAVAQHYRPTGGGGALPEGDVACCIAIADKLDNLVGLFGIGEPPSGSRDPFGLRRAAIGVLRTIIEHKLDLNLQTLLDDAAAAHNADFGTEEVLSYLADRLRYLYLDKGFAADIISAAFGAHGGINLVRLTDARVSALAAFRRSEACAAVAASNKRVANILAKADPAPAVDVELLEAGAEADLYQHAVEVNGLADQERDYGARLEVLATLEPYLARFFDDVMVMADDPQVRGNRAAILQKVHTMFLEVGDLAELQG